MSRKLNGSPADLGSESSTPSQSHVFDLSRRGYDREQVDEHMRTLLANLAATHKAHQYEHERANRVDADLRAVQAELRQLQLEQTDRHAQNGEGQHSFGYRVERLMRTAEQEAADVRASAAREATAMLEQAREQAEAHRHEVEHSLIARTATLEQDAARRGVALDERERQIAAQAAATQAEADRVLAEARQQADQQRDDAHTRSELERIKAEKAIRVRQDSAEHELVRLHTMHDEVRGQLGRLLTSLAGEFEDSSNPAVRRWQPEQHQSGSESIRQNSRHPRPHPVRSTGPHPVVDTGHVIQSPREPRDNNGGSPDHEFAQRG